MNKEDAKKQLWCLGILKWKLRPEQKKLRDLLEASPTDLAVFNISRRFGKSTTCAVFCVEQAIRKQQHIRYATAFLTDLENFILPIFEWILADCPDEVKPQYHASKKEYRFPNGSIIKLIGLDRNPNALRGNNIDILIIDEAAFVKNLKYLYTSVIVPATMKRKFKLIFPSTPPESPLHFWSAELIPKALERGTYVELTIDDISDLSQEEKDRLLFEVGGKDSITAQREFYCKILADENRAIAPNFNKSHISPNEPEYINWQIFGDAGGIKDKTVFLQVGYDHDVKKVTFRSELVFPPKTPTKKIVAEVKNKYGSAPIILDAPGQLLIDYNEAGLFASPPVKDEFSAGLLLLNNLLFRDEIVIHPDCKLLIATLKSGLLNSQRTDYERTEELGHCDAVAAAIYAIRSVDKLTDLRPRPSGQTHWINPNLTNQNFKNIEKLGWDFDE